VTKIYRGAVREGEGYPGTDSPNSYVTLLYLNTAGAFCDVRLINASAMLTLIE